VLVYAWLAHRVDVATEEVAALEHEIRDHVRAFRSRFIAAGYVALA
jgi:hypothetical protein